MGTSSTGGGGTNWQSDLLRAIGAPVNPTSTMVLGLWAGSEGMPDTYYNWLATTEPWPNAVSVNSVGVKRYASYSDGVAALAHVLLTAGSGGTLYYGDVVRSFRAQEGALSLWTAINASPWCHGCQDGKYPVQLFEYLHGATGALQSSINAAGGGGQQQQPAPPYWGEHVHATASAFGDLHTWLTGYSRNVRSHF